MPSLPEGVSVLVDGEHVIPQGIDQFLVASKSEAGVMHSVEWDDDYRDWTCTCMSYQCRQRCRHSKAIDRLSAGKADVRVAIEGGEGED